MWSELSLSIKLNQSLSTRCTTLHRTMSLSIGDRPVHAFPLTSLPFYPAGRTPETSRMSWDSYMDTLAGYTDHKMIFGGIYGFDGTRWTDKGDFAPNIKEVTTMVNACNNNCTDLSNAYTNGVYLKEKKFRFLRSDPEEKLIIFTRSEGEQLQNGCAVLTNQTILICVCQEASKGSAAVDSATKLAKYLKENAY
ncbi:uncharacterized protein LOC124256056 [Haliotis rubra]|uniref:uncharacterized protein LOC124256056 n=1 Tax=Haliotis rubra TaxID=36100 RepID=UPI001EE5F555|nr:uncharacterized protein LOC124256056 [Haliotis rubra]